MFFCMFDDIAGKVILPGKDIYIQDSLYYAEQDSLRVIDKINEMNYDE